jgi:hypothetical protein
MKLVQPFAWRLVRGVVIIDTRRAGSRSLIYGDEHSVRQQLGFAIQAIVLMLLPLLIGWQLFFGFRLLWMPVGLVIAIAVFSVGHVLRKP